MPFLLALLVGAVLTPLLGHLGLRAGLVDRPSGDGLKIHTQPRPLTGGIVVVAATLVGVAVADDLIPFWPVSAVLVLLLVGVVDDLRPQPPLLRLVAQLGAGVVLTIGGATLEPLGALGPLAVVLAVPFLTNATNIVDGQDGLAAGLGVMAGAGLFAIAAAQGSPNALGPALIGALVGFLIWNRPPARVFLGDGGAYAVGGMLAVLATGSSPTWPSLIGSVICLSVFALEMLSTVLRRAAGRTPLLSGDRAHVYDLMAERLGSRERATAVMWAAGAIVAVLGWLVSQGSSPVAIAVVVGVAAAGTLLVLDLWRSALRSSP